MMPRRTWVKACDVCPVPTGTTIDAKPNAPCSAGKKQTLHETGVVPRVPRSARRAQVLDTAITPT